VSKIPVAIQVAFRYDPNTYKAQSLNKNTSKWEDDTDFVFMDRLVRGEPDLDRLDGIPDWAYDAQGNLIP